MSGQGQSDDDDGGGMLLLHHRGTGKYAVMSPGDLDHIRSSVTDQSIVSKLDDLTSPKDG